VTNSPFRKDSYRNPNGLRADARRSPGRGMGRGRGQGRGSSGDGAREQWQRGVAAAEARRAEEQAKRLERETRLRQTLVDSEEAKAAWASAREVIASWVEPTTFDLWLAPIECEGEAEGALFLTAPDSIATWTERRYGRLIGDAVREVSEFRGIFLFAAPETAEPEEQVSCL
jgi:hypothetical protein